MRLFILAIMLGMGLGSAEPARSEQVWSDSFALDDSRTASMPLSGLKVEVGEGVWRGDKTILLGGDETATLAEAKGGASWLALDVVPASIRLEAEVNPVGSDWTALALGGKWGGAFYDTAAIWVLLKPTGDYQVRAQGSKLILKSGRIPRFSPKSNRVGIAYVRQGNRLSVTINDEDVLESFALDQKEFVPVLSSAGFKFNGPISTVKKPSIRGFRIIVEPLPSATATLNQPLSVYAPGERIVLKLSGSGMPEAGVKLQARIIDFNGRAVWNDDLALKVSDGKLDQELVVPDLGKLGFFSLHGYLEDSQGVVLASIEKKLAVIPKPKSEDNLFGAMVYPHIAYSTEDKERDAQYMKRIGVTFVRTARLNWVRAQSSKEAAFVWTDLDQEVSLYSRYGLKIIATTGWPIPSWASPATNESDRGSFLPREDCLPMGRQFMREMAARYQEKIVCYEIGNETDAYFWLGSLKHYHEHDTVGILRDYYDYFSGLADEIKASDSQALVAPSTTSSIPKGHMYQPWLKTLLDFGLGEKMSALATHYEADLESINAMLRQYKSEKPIFFTEIGGISRSSIDDNSQGSPMKQIIRGDYLQMSRQLRYKNVRALCKFLLREQPGYGGEGQIMAGLLGSDFELRPTYVAYATLIRNLAGANYVKELNVTSDSSQGWLQGSSYSRSGQMINLFFLNATERATVTFVTKESSLKLIDVMGNEEPITPKDGRVSVEMTKSLPLIVLGKLEDKPGAVQRPTDKLVREVEINLENADFEAASIDGGKIPGWRHMVNEEGAHGSMTGKFTAALDRDVKMQGQQSLRFEAKELTKWYGVSQEIPLALVPRPGPDEYLTFKVSLMVKGNQVNGKGMGYTLAFRRADMTRIYFMGSSYFGFGGTFDWKELSGSHQLAQWVPDTEKITLDLLMGKATGTLWVDRVKISVQLWKTAN